MSEKRKFYNSANTKGFTKGVFYEKVHALASGVEIEPEFVDLIIAACAYELEGIELRAEKVPGARKDPMESDYAKALIAAMLPLITAEPKSAKELIAQATKSGKLAPSGKEFSGPWVSRVLNYLAENSENGVIAIKKIVDKIDAKGLKAQSEVNAYKRG